MTGFTSLTSLPHRHRYALALTALAGLGLGGSALWVHAASDAATDKTAPAAAAKTKARPALSVTVTHLQAADWPITITANGNLTAWQEAVIGAEAGGLRLLEVLVNVGDNVRRGQVLARLQSESVAADVAASRANLAEAQAVLTEARANADRARQLQPGGAMSAQQGQQAFTAEQTAAARLEALKARLSADELRLSQTRITALDDGVISARQASVGAVVQPGQELFRLIRQRRLEWRAEVPATELVRIQPGTQVTLTPAGGTALQGKVRMVAPTVDPATRNGLVYVDLSANGSARAGMFAKGDFELGRAAAQTLPQSAVLLRDGFSYVFQVGMDNKVTQTKVATGRRQGDRIEITSGLNPTAKVVASGGAFLGDGDGVRVVESPAAQPAAAH
jgi:RND family efflux transporter MFP subunit